MNFLRLMIKNAARNQRRTLLTVLSVAVSLFLLASLRTFLTELEGTSYLTEHSGLRLITRHAVSLDLDLPIAYRQRVEQVPGVDIVVPFQWFGGIYQDPANFFAQFGTEPRGLVALASEYRFDPAQVEAWAQDRTGAVAGQRLMDKFGWKVGDRVTIQGATFPFDLELTLHGVYTGPDESAVYFHFDYFNELLREHLASRADGVGTFWLRVRAPEDVPRAAAAIDDMFRNSDAPTKTETEKAFNLSFTQMLGNVQLFIAMISAAVLFAVFLVAANTMAMSVRERTAEVAVLKTLGFRRAEVLALIVGESVLMALVGAVLGLGGARLLYGSINVYQMTGGIFQHFNVTGATLALAVALALVLGVLSAAVPAWRAASGTIASALRTAG